jgi:hypothetical protein
MSLLRAMKFLALANLLSGIVADSGAASGSRADSTTVIYASPLGRPNAKGTQSDPVDFNTGLLRLSDKVVLELLGGVYRIPEGQFVQLGVPGSGKSTIRAAEGERPIITRYNDYPPDVVLFDNTRVEGLWFGGVTDTENVPFVVSNNDELAGCVFWGYFGCINDASNHNFYENNLFVDCGRGDYYHPLYISAGSHSWDSCTTVRRNVFLGGGGYAIQLWHEPTYIRIQNNFIAAGMRCFASDGLHVAAQDNIFWSNSEQPMMLIRGEMTLTHNLIGRNHTSYQYRDPAAISVVADRNNFIEPASPGGPFGTNSIVWPESAAPTKLNVAAAQINDAVNAIQQSFSFSPDMILLDSTIAHNSAVLFEAIDVWGDLVPHVSVPDNPPVIPVNAVLYQNYPNPFNTVTTIRFSLPRAEFTWLKVYNVLGSEVSTLVSGPLGAGIHSVSWDATNLPSGMYICCLESGNETQRMRCLLLK